MSSPRIIDIQKLLKTKVNFRPIPHNIQTKEDVFRALTASTTRLGPSSIQELKDISDHFSVSINTLTFERMLTSIPQVLGEDDNYV